MIIVVTLLVFLIIMMMLTFSVADPENQLGDGGLSDEAVIMVKRCFRSLFEAIQLLFSVSAEKK